MQTFYIDGATHYKISPKENVPLLLNLTDESALNFSDKYMQLIEHGKDFEFSSKESVIKSVR